MEIATEDEQILATLAQTSFLNLWSWPNLYRDQGDACKGGDGKELCDLAVLFGEAILLFSDKRVQFQVGKPIDIAWKRWEKRAVGDSIKQLNGAERWITNNPERIFTDRKCEQKIPIDLSPDLKLEFFRIAVTHGVENELIADFGEASLSYSNHVNCPFTIFSGEGDFHHVFTGDSLLFVLNEIDTTMDFIEYLKFRRRLLARSGYAPVTL